MVKSRGCGKMVRDELIPMYQELYCVYRMLNKACWNGALPPSVITISYRLRDCFAYAQPRSEAECPLIAINNYACNRIDNAFLIGLLSHEMTHIWQYTQGRRGGHGRDFEKEMLRVGLDIPNGLILMDSPLVASIKQYHMKQINLPAYFSLMHKGDFSRRKQIDFYLANRQSLS